MLIALQCHLMRNGKMLIDDIRLKIDKVFELLSDHPFLISNPENARKMAEFRIFSLKKFQ